jgi:hypothetical protein
MMAEQAHQTTPSDRTVVGPALLFPAVARRGPQRSPQQRSAGTDTSFSTTSRAHLRCAGPDGRGREQRRKGASSREGKSDQGDPR